MQQAYYRILVSSRAPKNGFVYKNIWIVDTYPSYLDPEAEFYFITGPFFWRKYIPITHFHVKEIPELTALLKEAVQAMESAERDRKAKVTEDELKALQEEVQRMKTQLKRQP